MKTSHEAAQGSAETQKPMIFTEQFGPELGLVCEEFGIIDSSLPDLLEATQPWARGDHYDPTLSLELTQGQAEALQRLADSADMLNEAPLPQEHIDRILILGGEQGSNQQRVDWLISQIKQRDERQFDGSIYMLGGNRALKGRELQPLAIGLGRSVGEDEWVKLRLKSEINDIFTEDSGLRIALLAALGSVATLQQMHLRLGVADDREIVSHRVLSTDLGKVNLINARAENRPLGPSRHTTESSLLTWLDVDQELQGDETVVLVSSNPYMIRTHRNISRVVHSRFPAMNVFTCGPEAVHDEMLNRRIMGEIARNIYEDTLV